MSTPFNVQQLFGGSVQRAPDGSFIKVGTGARAPGLGDDASVMMISGVGAMQDGPEQGVTARASSQADAGGQASGATLTQLLSAKVRIAGYDVPVWLLFLVAMGGVGVAGWYFWGKRK